MDTDFVETELNGVKLRVFKDGTIMRYYTMKPRGCNIVNIGWNICNTKPNGINQNGYCSIHLNKKHYKCHRIIAMVYLGLDINNTIQKVDHIDRCKTNNNVSNLNVVSSLENSYNTNAKGYSWNKRDKIWKVHINVNKQRIYLGRFKDETEARNAYLEAKAKYHIIPSRPLQLLTHQTL